MSDGNNGTRLTKEFKSIPLAATETMKARQDTFRARFQTLRHSWPVARDQLGARAAAAVAADEAREKLDADLEMQRIV